MGFDPDAYLTRIGGAPAQAPPAPTAPGGFDPDAYLGKIGFGAGAFAPAPPDAPGAVQTFLRQGADAATFGFSGEIQGAFRALAKSDDEKWMDAYRRERDAADAVREAGAEAHPIASGAGTVAGTLATAAVPGLNVAKGAALTEVAGKAAIAGGLGAAGSSRADLTKGEVEDFAKDVATGAAAGAVIAPVATKVTEVVGKKLASGAAKRADGRILDDLVNDADGNPIVPKSIRDEIADNRGRVKDFVKEEGLTDATRDAAKLRQGAQEVASRLDSEAAPIAEKIAAAKKADAKRFVDTLERYHAKLSKNASKATEAKRVEKLIDRIRGEHLPDEIADEFDLLARASKGARGNAKERMGTRAKEMVGVLKKNGLEDLTEAEPVYAEKVSKVLGEKNAARDVFYEAPKTVRGTQAQTKVGELLDAADDLVKKAGSDQARQRSAEKLRAHIAEHFGPEVSDELRARLGTKTTSVTHSVATAEREKLLRDHVVPSKDLRAFVTQLQNEGFESGSFVDPLAAKKWARDVSGKFKDVLDRNVEKTLGPAKAAELKALNREISILIDVEKAAQRRAAAAGLKAPAGPKTDGLISVAEVEDIIRGLEDKVPKSKRISNALDDVQVRTKPKLEQKLAARLRAELNKHLEAQGLGEEVRAAEKIAEKRRTADLVGQVGVYKDRAETFAPTGLRSVMKAANPMTWPGEAAKKVIPAADRALLRYMAALRAGKPSAELAAAAIKAGANAALVQQMARRATAD